MPPGQPVHKCAGCGFYRPCRLHNAAWICVKCAGEESAAVVTGPSGRVATDGGEE